MKNKKIEKPKVKIYPKKLLINTDKEKENQKIKEILDLLGIYDGVKENNEKNEKKDKKLIIFYCTKINYFSKNKNKLTNNVNKQNQKSKR